MIENKIKKILFKLINSKKKIEIEKDFIESGLLDSFSILILIAEIEKQFSFNINMKKFEVKNFKNVKTITLFIKKNIKKR